MSIFIIVLLVIFALTLYFLPTIVANTRNHPNQMPIFIINLFLGWTFLIWVISLAWAFARINNESMTKINEERREQHDMQHEESKNELEYKGGCLCNETTYTAKGKPSNPHLCSCTMCQKSSGALTVAWVEFPLDTFQWNGRKPGLYQSSEKTQRCFC